jgi:hypothetical protein
MPARGGFFLANLPDPRTGLRRGSTGACPSGKPSILRGVSDIGALLFRGKSVVQFGPPCPRWPDYRIQETSASRQAGASKFLVADDLEYTL